MKVNEYRVMADVVELGIDRGWRRAYKHDDSPSPNTIREAIFDAVLDEVCDMFSLGYREMEGIAENNE